jgi:hypothetical protein
MSPAYPAPVRSIGTDRRAGTAICGRIVGAHLVCLSAHRSGVTRTIACGNCLVSLMQGAGDRYAECLGDWRAEGVANLAVSGCLPAREVP